MTKPAELAPYYRLHIFVCTNERPEGHKRGSCARKGSVELRDYMKARAKEMGLEAVVDGSRNLRVNSAGCLDRCELGPTMVIYPDQTWYRFATREDVDEILTTHIAGGQLVERLLLRREDGP